jgi:hypothetical protein
MYNHGDNFCQGIASRARIPSNEKDHQMKSECTETLMHNMTIGLGQSVYAYVCVQQEASRYMEPLVF